MLKSSGNIRVTSARIWLACLAVSALSLASCLPLFGVDRAQAAVQAAYYASPTGSGTTCSLASPCSITGARDKVRTVNSNMTGDIIVYIKQGDYHITSTVTFDQSDSGTNGYKIHYKNYDAIGSARFIGGEVVAGWTLHSGNIYKANVGTAWVYNDLYENGIRAVKARTPNVNSDYPVSTTSQGNYFHSESYNDTSVRTFKYASGDVHPAGWNDLSDVVAHIWSGGYYNWEINLIPVSGVDAVNRLITLASDTTYYLTGNSRYFLQGDLSFLDAPGEYYFDKSAGYLYYYPRATPIAGQTIIAPKVQSIFSFAGASTASPVKNIQLEGLSFEASNYVEHEATGGLLRIDEAMIFMKNTEDIVIKNNHLKNAGLDGILLRKYNKRSRIYGNWIEHVGSSGIRLYGYFSGETDKCDCNRDNVIKNNKLEFVGMHVPSSAGVYVQSSGHNDISYNYAAYAPRWLQIGGGEAAETATEEHNYFENNQFNYNDLYYGSQDSADTAAWSTWGKVHQSEANSINQLRVTHSQWDVHSDMAADTEITPFMGNNPIPPWGLYLDSYSDYWTVSNVKLSETHTVPPYFANGQHQTLTNVSWEAGFDESQMDYNNIGLKADFPAVYGNGGFTWVNDASVTVGGTWTTVSGSNYVDSYSEDERHSTTSGNYAQYTFTGTSVKLVGSLGSDRGKADVYIDNVLASTVDLYSPIALNQHVIYQNEGLSSGQHTIKAVVRNDKNASSSGYKVSLDAVGYAAPTTYFDGFESGLGSWTTDQGTATISTAVKRGGSGSYVVDEDLDGIQHNFGSHLNKVAVVWFYDDAGLTNVSSVANIDDGSNYALLGVRTSTSATHYSFYDGAWSATNVGRSTGWHRLVFDCRSGTACNMYIDGERVRTSTNITSFNKMLLGDYWNDGSSGSVYFDDISVQDHLPQPYFFDSFENGLGNWVSIAGTASASTTQQYQDAHSYAINEDVDLIQHNMGEFLNKVVVVWFYDDAGVTNMESVANIDNGANYLLLGVRTSTSTAYYSYYDGASVATNVPRTTGWHRFVFDCRSGTNTKMYIDGVLVHTSANLSSFNKILLGDAWTSYTSGFGYFDNVSVQDNMP